MRAPLRAPLVDIDGAGLPAAPHLRIGVGAGAEAGLVARGDGQRAPRQCDRVAEAIASAGVDRLDVRLLAPDAALAAHEYVRSARVHHAGVALVAVDAARRARLAGRADR